MATAGTVILQEYKKVVQEKYAHLVATWPVISGHDLLNGPYGDYIICIFKHTGNAGITSTNVVNFTPAIVGCDVLNETNIDTAREKIHEAFRLSNSDAVVILNRYGTNLNSEISKLLEYHEFTMGVKKMKIFLSHKGADKPMVRLYKSTLETLGFDVWLDEDAMPAGTALHRGILQGFKDSCAAIFFITPNYKDEGFLETEINYAITEKMAKGNKFAIITLVFEKDGK